MKFKVHHIAKIDNILKSIAIFALNKSVTCYLQYRRISRLEKMFRVFKAKRVKNISNAPHVFILLQS